MDTHIPVPPSDPCPLHGSQVPIVFSVLMVDDLSSWVSLPLGEPAEFRLVSIIFVLLNELWRG